MQPSEMIIVTETKYLANRIPWKFDFPSRSS